MKGRPNYSLQFFSFPEYKKLQDFYVVIIEITIKFILLYTKKEDCTHKIIKILHNISHFLT